MGARFAPFSFGGLLLQSYRPHLTQANRTHRTGISGREPLLSPLFSLSTNNPDVRRQLALPVHPDGQRRYPPHDRLPQWKQRVARPCPVRVPVCRPDVRAGACVGTRRSSILKGCWGNARSAIKPANRSGNADAHIPHPRLFRGANAPGESLALLRVFNCRHVRLVTADVKEQLDHR